MTRATSWWGRDGGVFAFGNAPFLGSLPGLGVKPTQPITGLVPTGTDGGYFLVGKDGGVFAFGNATYLGSLPGNGVHRDDIIGIAATPSGNGYWLVAADGTVYGFGAAQTLGSATGTSSPVTAIAGTPDGGGYWIVTARRLGPRLRRRQELRHTAGLGRLPGPPGDRHRPHRRHRRLLADRRRRRASSPSATPGSWGRSRAWACTSRTWWGRCRRPAERTYPLGSQRNGGNIGRNSLRYDHGSIAMTPRVSTKSSTDRSVIPSTVRVSFALVITLILWVVASMGGAASAHGNGTPTTSTTKAHRESAKSRGAQPELEAGVLYRATGSAYGGFGNGEARPRSISTSGVGATNGVIKIVWKSWGGKTATGVGTGCVIKDTGIEANCRVTRATVVAYDLGTCGGQPAYLAVTWYFPTLRQKLVKKGTIPNPACGANPSKQRSTTATAPPASTTTAPPPSTTSVPSATSTSTAGSASGASAPCTTTAITAASKAFTSNFYSVTGFGCSGIYAYAFVTVTGTNGQPIAEVTQVFQATSGSWHVVSRAVCTSGAVPTTIYQQACQTN